MKYTKSMQISKQGANETKAALTQMGKKWIRFLHPFNFFATDSTKIGRTAQESDGRRDSNFPFSKIGQTAVKIERIHFLPVCVNAALK
jgi:hypothetical protein